MVFRKPSQADLKLWAELDRAKVRRERNLFLAEGAKVVRALLRSRWRTRALLVLSGREEHLRDVAPDLTGQTDLYRLNEREWRRISQDQGPEGIMALASVPETPSPQDPQALAGDRLLLLHEVGNPNNLGALLRTADWFGFRTVLLSARAVDFTHPKVVRTAMGSLFHLTLIGGVDFASVLPRLGTSFHLVGSDVRGGDRPHACAGRVALLLGSETHGLPQHLLGMTHEQWRIEGSGAAESLSLPQAAAVMMYACTPQ